MFFRYGILCIVLGYKDVVGGRSQGVMILRDRWLAPW